jgi:hypothetical protein
LTNRNRGTSKVGSFDSEWSSYSTKVPSDLFLPYGIMFKKHTERRKMTAGPAVHIYIDYTTGA